MNLKDIEKKINVEDGHILLDQPFVYEKYGKKITVKQVNYYYEWSKFTYCLVHILKRYYIMCTNSKLPDSLNELKEFQQNFRGVVTDKEAFKYLTDLCSLAFVQVKVFGKWVNFLFGKINKIRWMKKTFSIDDWIELFIYMYLYNVKGQKKNFKIALSLIGQAQ